MTDGVKMKVTQQEVEFKPIIIVLESLDEMELISMALRIAMFSTAPSIQTGRRAELKVIFNKLREVAYGKSRV